jgi:hypothetical protein
VSEAIALFPKDVNYVRGAICELHGKGNKSRTVGIDRGAIQNDGQVTTADITQAITRFGPCP